MATNVPNPGTYEATIGQHIIDLRDAINNLVKDGTYLNAMGGAAFLTAAPFNMSPGDAALYESTIGAVTAQNAVVQSILSFINSAVPLTGGN